MVQTLVRRGAPPHCRVNCRLRRAGNRSPITPQSSPHPGSERNAPRKLTSDASPSSSSAFTGARPGMKVLDMSPAAATAPSCLRAAVAPGGHRLLANTADMCRQCEKDVYETRAQSAAMKNVVRVERPTDDPSPSGMGGLDLITFFFNYHDTVHMGVNRPQMNLRIFEALKPGVF